MIVAGFGFRAAASAASLRNAYDLACGAHRPQCLATAADKAQSPAFVALSRALGLPIRAVPPQRLAQQGTATRSATSMAARGTGSVAEAAALAAAGAGATLLQPRRISTDRMATCALAEGENE
ncbi:cobalamin biosynthesis protein [Thalassococcus sp. BH17M4-6]|uniref:cobalamin biosynthesis protein n=1 Tax=Thalassococcus sp. BH17M4-6 TaxID=3413148 RepID=UPI003BBFCBBC